MLGLTDELWSGIAVVAAPAVEREQSLEHAGYTFTVFAVPLLLSAIAEAGLLLASDRLPRKAFVVGGLAALAVALGVCAHAHTPWLLSLGLAMAGAASGAACGAAQAELVQMHESADKALARWTAFAAAGDVLSPVVVAAVIGLGYSYRVALQGVAVVIALQAAALWVGKSAGSTPEGARLGVPDGAEPLRPVLARGARNPRLWIWLFGVALCVLLDEIAAALAALRLRNELGATEAVAAASLTCFSAGSLVGAVLCERFVDRFSARRILLVSALASTLALGLVLVSPSPWWMCAALALLGASTAPHYPLAKARAYDAMPGRPGLVNAAGQLFVVIDVAAPLALGVVADHAGISVAIACLIAQPAGLALLALSIRCASRPTRSAFRA